MDPLTDLVDTLSFEIPEIKPMLYDAQLHADLLLNNAAQLNR